MALSSSPPVPWETLKSLLCALAGSAGEEAQATPSLPILVMTTTTGKGKSLGVTHFPAKAQVNKKANFILL